jgi:hypothetical protein
MVGDIEFAVGTPDGWNRVRLQEVSLFVLLQGLKLHTLVVDFYEPDGDLGRP